MLDDVPEQIERFAGYLKIFDEDGRVAPLFEGEDLDWTPDPDNVPQTPVASSEVSLTASSLPPLKSIVPTEIVTTPDVSAQAVSIAVPTEKAGMSLDAVSKVTNGPAISLTVAAPTVALPAPIWPSLPQPGPIPDEPETDLPEPDGPETVPFPGIKMAYSAVGLSVASAVQGNGLDDGDALLANPGAGLPEWAGDATEAREADLVATLDAELIASVPAEILGLRDAASSPFDLVETMDSLLGQRAAAGDVWFSQIATGPGIWMDGVLYDEKPERPAPALNHDEASAGSSSAILATGGTVNVAGRPGPGRADAQDASHTGHNGLEEPGVEMATGGNTSEQAATIRDLDDIGGTIVVMGDVHDLSVIWQTNVLSDIDEIMTGFGAAETAGSETTTANVAWFEDVPAFFGPGVESRPSTAIEWNVDIVEGNLFDLNLLFQFNEIRDNDLAVHQHTTAFSRIVTGDNEALAEAAMTTLSDYYDVIVVGGSLVRANLIFQSNRVIDDDTVRLLSDGEGTQSVDSGGNVLWNDAQVRISGSDTFTPLDAAGRDFHAALAGGATSADTPFALPVHGGGGKPLNVLYVTGDFFDVNVIGQTSVIHDADAVLQVGHGERIALTGANVSTNSALIVDTRGQGDIAMVGGSHYDDDMLIQTNIIAEDTELRIISPETLATEVIAFLDPDQMPQSDEPGVFGIAVEHTAASDVMGGVLA